MAEKTAEGMKIFSAVPKVCPGSVGRAAIERIWSIWSSGGKATQSICMSGYINFLSPEFPRARSAAATMMNYPGHDSAVGERRTKKPETVDTVANVWTHVGPQTLSPLAIAKQKMSARMNPIKSPSSGLTLRSCQLRQVGWEGDPCFSHTPDIISLSGQMHIAAITSDSTAKSAPDRASYLRNVHMPKPDSRDDQFEGLQNPSKSLFPAWWTEQQQQQRNWNCPIFRAGKFSGLVKRVTTDFYSTSNLQTRILSFSTSSESNIEIKIVAQNTKYTIQIYRSVSIT